MTKYHKTKHIFYNILNPSSKSNFIEQFADYFIIVLITLNVICSVLESFSEIADRYRLLFNFFELFSVVIFTAEYLIRIWVADLAYCSKRRVVSRLKFILSPMAIIDLVAIIPFYLPMLITVNLRFLRILRLFRLLRVLKINRYNSSIKLIFKVLTKKREELIITIFITFILLLLSSSVMYHIETEAQPEAFPNIIASFWWAVATLTTVGYGDVYPVTITGKILSGIIALLGIGLVALPTGIISSGFMEEITENRDSKPKKKCFCPYCGENLNEE